MKMWKKNWLGLVLTALFTFVVLTSGEAIASTRMAKNTVPAYTDQSLTNRNGNERVDRGDAVVVLQETNDACYVRYPTPNGSKDRWVSKCIFATVVNPNEGDYYILPESNTNHAIDVKGGGQAAVGTPLQIYQKNNSDAQLFTIKRVNGDWYKIIHKRTGLVMNVQGGNDANSARLWLYHDDGTDSCYWRFIDAGNGSYIIQSKLGQQRVFDLYGNNAYSGAVLHLWQYHTNQAARWKLTQVSSTPPSDNVSARQQSMVSTARRYLGNGNYNGYCQRFVRVVGQNIGLPAGNAASALDAWNSWRVSTDRNIPIGATVYLRGKRQGTNGYKYGHVGIYSGNGNVIHALTTVKEQPLTELLNTFDYLGWGWQAGVDLR